MMFVLLFAKHSLSQNVFIAVVTETFAEIRVQFSQIWASRETIADEEYKQV